MDIAAISMSLSANSVSSQASVSILKKSMDGQEQAAVQMLNSLAAANPTTPPMPQGQHIDVYA